MNIILEFIEKNLFNQALILIIAIILCLALLSGLLKITAKTRKEASRMIRSEQFGFMGFILYLILAALHLLSYKLFGIKSDILSSFLNTNMKKMLFFALFIVLFTFLFERSVAFFRRNLDTKKAEVSI